jgi:predicted ATPase/class 3 adenylate cyclase
VDHAPVKGTRQIDSRQVPNALHCQPHAAAALDRTSAQAEPDVRARAGWGSISSFAPAVHTPSGTITFLFTDIEDSSRSWDTHPDMMMGALTRHNAIVRAAIERQGGYVFKTVGDSFHAAFATARAALSAAVAAQWALAGEDWGVTAPGAVRMALHTGTADGRDGDYFGPALNRVARLRDAGHGGQILLSEATAALLRGQVPDGVELRDLGVHRLRGLTTPEHVYQAAVWGLPADFPPLRFVVDRPACLPAPLTSLIGRDHALARVTRLVTSTRLVTLTGPGGIGKTRLALAAAHAVRGAFAEGAVFVDLAPLTSAADVARAIADALGLHGATPADAPLSAGNEPAVHDALPRETLVRRLRDRQVLLMLDNFEHVCQAAPLVSELLAACPRLHILATSRAALHLRGEAEFRVPPLTLPEGQPSGGDSPVGCIAASESVRLFVARAQAARPDFLLTEENAEIVAEICHRLDGLPLAIELAAARARILPLRTIAERLVEPLTLLAGGARDLPGRQRSLRDNVRWSYDLLSPAEQSLLCRLAVRAGEHTLESVEGLAGGAGSTTAVLEMVSTLVQHALLRLVEGGEASPRFVLPDLVRQFAIERCAGRDGGD